MEKFLERVALLKALVTSPLLLLLDEPFASLDNPVRGKLRLDLIRIREEDHAPVVFVTHDVEEAFVLSDEIVVINDGKVEQVESKEDLQRYLFNSEATLFSRLGALVLIAPMGFGSVHS
jgi:ABC-type Fe3+/spermidine/putrescine transport system ATPase subunit